jgi:protein-disulfide isomerase
MSGRERIGRRTARQRRVVIALAAVALVAVLVLAGAIALSLRQASTKAQPLATTVQTSGVPNADDASRAWGPANAPIQVTEYLDYQCPLCAHFAGEDEQAVIAAFAPGGQVRWEVRSMAFIGTESIDAARATLCAAAQGRFGAMHRALFANPPQAANQGAYSKERLAKLAAQIGLAAETFDHCLNSAQHADTVDQERAEAARLGIQQAPTFVVNSRLYPGLQTVEDFKRIFAEVAPGVQVKSTQ